jgi:predicted DsbA family dithiol-disulfide isomerase
LVNSESNLDVTWRAFELRPEPVPTLPPGGEYLRRVWDSSVYPLAEKLGVVMKMPPVQPRSRLAHEAAQWARAGGKFGEMNAAIFRAFFERGEDIGDREVLISIAADLKLDAAALRRALEGGDYTESVLADEEQAEWIGISGVPAFVANRQHALSGVQSLENLRMLITRARSI